MDEFVLAGGARLRVRRLKAATGSLGPVLVFLHDSLGCVETWRDFPQALAEQVGRAGIVYDRQGYGQSAPMKPEPRTLRYMHDEAESLVELLASLQLERVVLFGHSDGGSIALLAAAARPALVAGVITVGAHVFVEELTLAGIRDARHLLATSNLRERLRRYHGGNTDGLTAAWIDTWLSPAFRDWNIESDLARIHCPVLVVQGERDEYGTAAQVEAIVRGVAGVAEALMVPGAGHTPHRDAADTVLAASAAFIRPLA